MNKQRTILIDKLNKIGIHNTELKWFKSYITNRVHKTKHNRISDPVTSDTGVLQGSILSPLLSARSLMYIMDNIEDTLLYVCDNDGVICIMTRTNLKQKPTKSLQLLETGSKLIN